MKNENFAQANLSGLKKRDGLCSARTAPTASARSVIFSATLFLYYFRLKEETNNAEFYLRLNEERNNADFL